MREHLNTLVGEKEEIRNNGTTVVVSLYLVHGRKGRAKKRFRFQKFIQQQQ